MSYFDTTLEAAPVAEMDYTPVLPEERHVFELIGFERSEPDQWRKDGGIRWTWRVYEADGVKPFIFQDERYEFFRNTGLTREGKPNFNVGTYANDWASAMLGRPLGTDADFKISELRGKRMSAMVTWEKQKTDPKKKTIKLASLRHVPVAGAGQVNEGPVRNPLSSEPTEADVDRELVVMGLLKSVARLKKVDKIAWEAAEQAVENSDLDTAPLADIRDLWTGVKNAIAKAMEDDN